MDIEWTQVVPAGIIGAGLWSLFQHIFLRWYEQRHIDEELDRSTKAVDLAERMLSLHDKLCDRNFTMKMQLSNNLFELLPISDDQLAEDEGEHLELMEVGQYWLVSLMWNCVNLILIKGEHLSVDEVIEHSKDSYIAAYDLMSASDLMRDFGDITLTQMVHSYYGYLTQKTDADADAVVKAMENWVESHLNDDDVKQDTNEA